MTVAEAKCRALPDADLVAQARGRCEVLVTADHGFEHEHNLKNLTSELSSSMWSGTAWNTLLFDALVDAVDRIRPDEVVHVSAPQV